MQSMTACTNEWMVMLFSKMEPIRRTDLGEGGLAFQLSKPNCGLKNILILGLLIIIKYL